MKLRFFGLPLHPLLVHFPIAFWIVVPVLDTAALTAGLEPWWTLALAAAVLGLVTGAAAIAAGLLEYIQPSLAGIDTRLSARHGVRTTLAWLVFGARVAVALSLPRHQWTAAFCLLLDLAGTWLLVQGVYFGTRQVYQQLEEQ
jgi:uncharacterized membrane protein